MKLVIAPDSYKGALSATEAATAIALGFRRVLPEATLVHLPIADGGEGTLATLVSATGGEYRDVTVCGPLGSPVSASLGLLPEETAVVELAQAAGLGLVPADRRDPKVTTTFGVGELIAEALRLGSTRLIITLGGSATNDGGLGLLRALGVEFLGGETIQTITGVRSRPSFPTTLDVQIACDVENLLTGPNGASAVFGPQKGATPNDVAFLDAGLKNLAKILGLPEMPGDGAAGGAAYGLRWLFPQAKLISGIELVLETVGFDAHLETASLVFTGEGRLDGQTLGGKAVAGIARRAKKRGVPVCALVGSVDPKIDSTALAEAGVTMVVPIAPGPCTLDESIRNTNTWLADAAERSARWLATTIPHAV